MKKKILALIITALMCLSMAACGSAPSGETSSPQSQTSSSQSSTTSSQTSEAQPEALPSSGEIGDYTVTIQDCFFENDHEGKKTIIVNWDFTNNSDEPIMPFTAVQLDAFQDGVELEIGLLISDNYDSGIAQKQVKPGASLTGCQSAFVLSSESEVEVEVSKFPSIGDSAVLAKTFNVE